MNQNKLAVRRRHVQIAPANELIKKPFLNEYEVSAITGRAVSTLRNDRFLRRGIPYLKVSLRSIRYRTPDVLNFMEARPIHFEEATK
ncbi:MAG TPA: hypothetical protein PLP16_12000 [Smithellaceae bacterium]|nr:hypothetical protein [Smithellaceae bacterium]